MLDATTYVYCQTRVIGFHSWPNAPDEVKYLRNKHRHEFHIKVTVKVEHNDRDIEFITLRSAVDRMFDGASAEHDFGAKSCEMIAEDIIYFVEADENYKIYSVEVSEDGENGAIVICQ
jgi:hypothetical protein